jgi:hypothetical protein
MELLTFNTDISSFYPHILRKVHQVLSNFYAIGFLWRRCNFRGKCRARYCDVAKTTCGFRQSNYLPLLLYRIPLTVWYIPTKSGLFRSPNFVYTASLLSFIIVLNWACTFLGHLTASFDDFLLLQCWCGHIFYDALQKSND